MRIFEDTYQHKGLRKKLIDLLRQEGIRDENVLSAMNAIPRHYFLDSAFDKIAYENKAFDIGEGQTISHPYTVAMQTQLLEVQKKEKILEIGTGSVYQASVLAELGAQVFTIERQKKLFLLNKNFVFKKNYPHIHFFYGDGFLGLPTYAPFDKIIITAAAPFIPPRLIEQLKTGGLMVIPVNTDEPDNKKQRMMRLTKMADGTVKEEVFSEFEFVPMLQGKNK